MQMSASRCHLPKAGRRVYFPSSRRSLRGLPIIMLAGRFLVLICFTHPYVIFLVVCSPYLTDPYRSYIRIAIFAQTWPPVHHRLGRSLLEARPVHVGNDLPGRSTFGFDVQIALGFQKAKGAGFIRAPDAPRRFRGICFGAWLGHWALRPSAHVRSTRRCRVRRGVHVPTEPHSTFDHNTSGLGFAIMDHHHG